MTVINEKEQEILTKAADILYLLAIKTNSSIEAKTFKRASEFVQEIIDDYTIESEE